MSVPLIILTPHRGTALAWWLMLRRPGYGLEVPINWQEPHITFLPDTNRGRPEHQRVKYYTEGGSAWPDRYLMTAAD